MNFGVSSCRDYGMVESTGHRLFMSYALLLGNRSRTEAKGSLQRLHDTARAVVAADCFSEAPGLCLQDFWNLCFILKHPA